MAPYFLYRAWRHQKYLPALRQRLGNLPDTLKADGRRTIWIHSCSVGETLSVQPLAQALSQRFPDARFVFSARLPKPVRPSRRSGSPNTAHGNTFYFPIDLASIANKVLDHNSAADADYDRHRNLAECSSRSKAARICRSHGQRAHFRAVIRNTTAGYSRFLGTVFQNYNLLLMKSQEDAERIQRMGASPSKIRISGNIKYDRNLVEKEVTEAQARHGHVAGPDRFRCAL